MKFKNFVKSLASSGVIYNRGVEELPLADRWLASPHGHDAHSALCAERDRCGHSGNAPGYFQDA